jgi:outer membrane protein
MKKIVLKTALLGSLIVSAANADVVRVEMGAGAWGQTPSGTATYDAGAGVEGTNTFNETKDTSPYVWMLIKHPIPIVPNIRLEYVSIHSTGKATGGWDGNNIPAGITADSTWDLKEYDIIPYYNLLDNTFWTTIDLGIDIKVVDSDYKVAPIAGFTGYEDTRTVTIPLAYLRARVEIPATNVGLEADCKYVTYNGSTVYDARAKIDYTFDFIPLVQPAIEVGYRAHKINIDDSSIDVKSDVDFRGFYAGLMLRF